MPLPGVPFPDMIADTGSGADDPHPTRVTRRSPSTFMDADHTAAVACARVEIIPVDPRPFYVDGTSTSGTSAT